MCVCASESNRPRLFNWVSVILVTAWVLVVTAVAHSVPGELAADELNETSLTAVVEAFLNPR